MAKKKEKPTVRKVSVKSKKPSIIPGGVIPCPSQKDGTPYFTPEDWNAMIRVEKLEYYNKYWK